MWYMGSKKISGGVLFPKDEEVKPHQVSQQKIKEFYDAAEASANSYLWGFLTEKQK